MLTATKEKLNEAIMMLNKNLQEINIQNMDTELVAQMFKNYQSNVLFHLEGKHDTIGALFTEPLTCSSNKRSQRSCVSQSDCRCCVRRLDCMYCKQ